MDDIRCDNNGCIDDDDDDRSGRGYTSSCLGPNQGIYISGGLHHDTACDTIEVYDIRKGTWRENNHTGELV